MLTRLSIFFICVLLIPDGSLWKVLHVFCPFYVKLLSSYRILWTMDTNPLLPWDVMNIFSQFVANFFTFLLMHLEEHKLQISPQLCNMKSFLHI